MSTVRRLRSTLATTALLAACTPGDPPADAGSTTTQTTDVTQSSFTGEPTPTGTTATSTGEPTTGATGPTTGSTTETTADPTTDALTGTTDPTTTAATGDTGDTTTGTTGADTTDSTTGTDTAASTTGTDTTGTDTTDSTTGTDTTGTDTTDTTTGDPVCGDGVREGDELCDDGNRAQGDACLNNCTSGRALLALAGLSQTPAAFVRFVPGPGWTFNEAGTSVAEAAFAPLAGGGAVVVVRRLTVQPQDNNELLFTTWSPGQPDKLTGFTEVGEFGFALDGPALAPHGDATLLSFLGTDNKHYWAQRSGGVWGPFTALPASMQVQAFGPSAAALAGEDPGAYAVYAGDNALVYHNYKSAPGGAWSTSNQASPPPVLNALTPTAVVDAEDDLVVAYVRKSDNKIGVVKLVTPQNSWTAETIVHTQAVTTAEVSLVRTDSGAYYLAWRSPDGKSVSAARGAAFDQWSAPISVESGPSMQPPTLTPGTPGAEAELLYVADGELHHARLSGETADVADVPGAVGLTTRAAALRVQVAP